MPGIDYSKRYRDYARFTPAISEMYTRFIVNQNPKRPMPGGLVQKDLDYLDPNSQLFYLPCSLYSAGQAAKSDGAAAKKDMVTDRDRSSTIILGDSGGFQIQMGSIKFKGDETRNRMMKWMEANCDWSMILDFPTGGINMGTIDPHYARLVADLDPKIVDSGNREALEALIRENGQSKEYNTCLLQTLINNDWFVKNRTPGATKFLNVVQGRNTEESKIWYEKVKHYPFEGWSLAGPHKENFVMALSRIIEMRDDGLLQDRDWMHFLGVGKLQNGCAYTTIQRCVRESINPNFTISYDVSSPFTTAAFGNLFLGYTLDKNAWTIQSTKMEDDPYLRGGEYTDQNGVTHFVPRGPLADRPLMEVIREAWENKMGQLESEIILDPEIFGSRAAEIADELRNNSRLIETEMAKRLNMEDICFNVDPKFTSSWDVVSYALLMNHNVQVHLEAVFESQDLYDKGDTNRVPSELLELKDVICEVFKSETPMDVIANNAKILNCLAGEAASGGVLVTSQFEMANIQEHQKQTAELRAQTKPSPVEPEESILDLFDFPENDESEAA